MDEEASSSVSAWRLRWAARQSIDMVEHLLESKFLICSTLMTSSR